MKFLTLALLSTSSLSVPLETVQIFLDPNQTTSSDDEGPSHPISAFTISQSNLSLSIPIVRGTYIDSIPTIGQGRLTVSTLPVDNGAASDRDLFYALGLAEGYLTAKRIVQQIYNVVWSKPRQNQYIYEFLSSQYNYMRAQSSAHWRDDPYWYQVG